MKIINYISIIAMPMVIFIIISEALKERKNVFDIFLKGAAEGVGISYISWIICFYWNAKKLWNFGFYY